MMMLASPNVIEPEGRKSRRRQIKDESDLVGKKHSVEEDEEEEEEDEEQEAEDEAEGEQQQEGRRKKKRRKKVKVYEGLTDDQRRELRRKQRKLNSKLQTEDFVQDETAEEGETLDQVRYANNKLFKYVKYARELVLDADNVDVLASKYAKQVEQKVQVPRYDPLRLVGKLVQKCTAANGFDWKTLGVEAGICFNALPSRCSFAAGRWDNPMEAKKKKERAPRGPRFVENAKEQAPEQIVEKKDATSSQSLSIAEANVKRLGKKLKQQYYLAAKNSPEQEDPSVDGIPFLVDPNSFTKTVENMFYYSFLIKKGEADVKVAKGLGGGSRFELRVPPLEQGETKAPPPTQAIVSLTMRDWRRLREACCESSD